MSVGFDTPDVSIHQHPAIRSAVWPTTGLACFPLDPGPGLSVVLFAKQGEDQ
ncbi:MAG: hypothetical protein AAFP04_10435 [Myxococcota bacterium]